MKDLMVDLETLGTRPGSVILSLGAVFFDPLMSDLGPGFYQVIVVASSCVAGLRGDVDTIKWWSEQSPEARVAYDEAFLGRGEPLLKTLEAFSTFLVSQSGEPDGAASVRVWGNGAAFDNALLAEAYRACGLGVPWKSWHDRCFRTLKALGKDLGVKEPRFEGTPHHAFDDACHQARWACSVLRALAPSPVPEGDWEKLNRYLAAGQQRGKTQAQEKVCEDLVNTGLGVMKLTHVPAETVVKNLQINTVRREGDETVVKLKQWPVCQVHGDALIPTTTGFVCEKCGGGS